MITIRTKTLLLCACFINALWLLVAQTLNSTALLLPCLLCFLALVAWAAIKNTAMPVMLFFLPFSPLLKIRPGTISLFTLALLMIYAIYTVTGSRQVKVLHLIPALLIIVLSLIVKAAYNYEIDNSYIMFAVTLLLVPFLTRELDGGYDFYWLTVCFALGICLAAITAQYQWMSRSLKTMPKGYPADHPLATYLKMKEYLMVMYVDEHYFDCDDWVERVATDLQPLKPLHDFLNYVFE